MAGEANLWSWLEKARVDDVDMNRVENSIGSGTPDVEGCRAGRQFWVELKSEDRPKRPGTPIRFNWKERQIPWLQRRWMHGGQAFALLGVGRHPKRVAYLVPAPHLDLMQPGLTEEDLARMARSFLTARVDGWQVVRTMTMPGYTPQSEWINDGERFYTRAPFTSH